MSIIKNILSTLIVLLFIQLNAQKTIVYNEVSVLMGLNFMQTDYGQANNFKSTISNAGPSGTLAYIADFSDSRYHSKISTFLIDYVKPRLEISFSKTNFKYDGKLALNPKFKAMKGETKLINIGFFSEIYIRSLMVNYKIKPYLLTGISYTKASPNVSSELEFPSIFIPEKENIFLKKQYVFSFTSGAGLRYKINNIDLVFESKYQYFLSDKIEGLSSTNTGSKNNDTQVIFNFGVVFQTK